MDNIEACINAIATKEQLPVINHVRVNSTSMMSVECYDGEVYLVDMTLVEAHRILRRKERRLVDRW